MPAVARPRDISFHFQGRVALVTGAAAGLGRVLAQELAAAGADLLLTDVQGDSLAETARLIEEHGHAGRCETRVADVRSAMDVDALFGHLDQTLGRIDVLFNVAGINPLREAPEHFPLDVWNAILAVNLTGTLLCSQAAARRMLAQGQGGSMVNVSSITASSSSRRGNAAFGTSKAAVNHLTRELAVAWAPHGIRVNAVEPGQIHGPGWETWRTDPARAAWLRGVMAGIPAGRMVTNEEVAWAMLFLASDAASMITGTVLPVEGGNLSLNAGAVDFP